jgi:hypothetical protein
MHDTDRTLAGIAERTLADLGLEFDPTSEHHAHFDVIADRSRRQDAFELQPRPSQQPDMTPLLDVDVLAAPWRWVCSVVSFFDEYYWTLDHLEKRQYDVLNPLKFNVLPPFPHVLAYGSGIVVSPRHVLTAGQNVYGWSGHYEPDDTKTEVVQPRAIRVVPARRPVRDPDTLSGPYGVWKVARVLPNDRLFSYRQRSQNFYTDMDNPLSGWRQQMAFDFVLLEIEPKGIGKGRRHMGEQTPKGSSTPLGWWCQSSDNAIRVTDTKIDRQDLSNRSVNVAGYPIRNRSVDRMYRGFHYVRSARRNIVEHRVEAGQGTSGGPIWTFNSNQTPPRQLVGMHTMSGNSDTSYAPRLLNPMGLVIHHDLAAFLKKHVPGKYLRFV